MLTWILARYRNWFSKPEIQGELSNSVNKHVVKRVEVETSRIIKKINLEKINHETEHIKISQNQYTDRGTQQVDLSWTFDTVNVQVDV